jgi:single-strand DNA-binding protein
MNEVTTTLVGNLSRDNPELRFTPSSGVAVCKFRMAQTPRVKKGDSWEDGEAFWINVTCWRELAEHVAETITGGMRVIVQARLSQRSYDHKDGYKVTVVEAEADEVGPSLRYATATVTKVAKQGGAPVRSGGDDARGGATPARPAGAAAGAAAANADEQRAAQPAASPW